MGKTKTQQLSDDEFEAELLKIETDADKHNETYQIPETKEKETEMKISNTKKIVLSTIATTVFVLAVLVATFYAGTQYEANKNLAIQAEATKLVEQLKSENQ